MFIDWKVFDNNLTLIPGIWKGIEPITVVYEGLRELKRLVGCVDLLSVLPACGVGCGKRFMMSEIAGFWAHVSTSQ